MKKAVALLLVAVMMMSLAGCGDQTQPTKEQTAEQTTAETKDESAKEEKTEDAAPKEKTDITFVLDWTPNTNHTGLYVAKEKGYFDEAGININIVQPPDGGATQMVASGDAQFGIEFQDTMAPALSQKDPLPITAIAAVLQHNTSGLVSLKEKGIDSFGKMADHSYATWDSPTEQAILKTLCEKDGGDWSKVNLVSTYVEDIVAGLNSDIDSVWVYAGWDKVKLEMEGIDHNFLLFKDFDPVFDYYSPVIIGNNDFINGNKDVTKALVNAIKKGYEDAAKNPDEAAEILLKAAPELDKELVKKSQAYLSTQYIADAKSWGEIDPARWNAFYKWLNDNKLVENELPENAGLSTEFLS